MNNRAACLAAHGASNTVHDLDRHRGGVHFSGRTGRPCDWDFSVDGQVPLVHPQGRMATPKLRVFADRVGGLFAANPQLCATKPVLENT